MGKQQEMFGHAGSAPDTSIKSPNWHPSTTKAVNKAEAHAEPSWSELAFVAGGSVARLQAKLTSIEIDDRMIKLHPHVQTAEKRAMGAVMKRLQSAGIIEPTAEFTTSNRPNHHNNPKRVWKSRVYVEPTQ